MKKLSHFLVPLMMGLLILASIVWYLFIYDRDFTRDSLLSQARFQDMHGNSRMSAFFYDAAYSFSGHDENVAIELANQYKHDGNYTKAEVTLTEAINNTPTVELYTALCRTYVEQDKLLDAVNLLDNLGDPDMKQQLDALRPAAPSSDYDPGYYSQYMDIHLNSDSLYLFYTMDGTYPSIEGSHYSGSITLPAGETTIYAIAVDEDGLVSPVAVLGYTITGVIEEVVFTDPTMEAAIRECIGADSDDKVFTDDLWEVTEFTAPEGVRSFADLSLLSNLTKLTIQNQTIDSLNHLSNLSKLVILDLSGCKFDVDELSIVAQLPALSSLTLASCSLSTIEGLEGAANLTMLDLNNNTIRNLSVLSDMTTLAEINLEHNALTDLSALKGLENLSKLNVSYNSLISLAPLSSCIRLRHVEADHNQLPGINGMEKLSLLEHLSVDYNALTDVSLLAGNTELTNLSIASNDITDLSALRTLTKLQVFDFSSNKVEALPAWPDGCALTTIDGSYNALASIDGLKNMQSLTHVYMDYNLLTNIDALADCFCLVQVNVFGNQIPNVDALRDHDIIVNYDPTV
ncbi:MAG: chitobiase/beta-hexosaminidase C-terminal domain-containing protein [Oscillospiraceae bacterium]|nr:chitobiase/beta-hexosaminidase C-terminal domain-containing protein [Oscillospiraceae bacterium]